MARGKKGTGSLDKRVGGAADMESDEVGGERNERIKDRGRGGGRKADVESGDAGLEAGKELRRPSVAPYEVSEVDDELHQGGRQLSLDNRTLSELDLVDLEAFDGCGVIQ